MPISDELKARLHHGSHEIGQVQQLLAAALDHVQTVVDDIQLCNDRADLVDPAFDTLNRQIHALTEEIKRVSALRSNEGDLHLRLENSKLKRDLAALQEAIKSDEELAQHIGSLERFNQMLKSKLNEMKEMYESAIIEVADLKEKNKTLYNMAAFNVVAKTETSSNANSGNLAGQMPFGRTVVETNRGLTVTIESSSAGSPDKATLNQGWIPPIPSGAAFPFPDIVPQPQFTGLDPTNAESTQLAIRLPKARPIVKGTKEANESFERMKRTLVSSPLTVPMNVIKVDNNTKAALSPSTSAIPMTITNDPETPSNMKSKLNPAVAAFAPTHSSGKESANSGSAQTSSPTKDESKPSVAATDPKEGGFIPPHLRRIHNTSTGMKDNVQVTPTPDTFVKPDPGLQAWLDNQENAPSNDASSQELTATIKDTLIDIDPYSPEKGNKKAAILPPGFIPFSTNDGAPAMTQDAVTEPKASAAAATEKERNAAFLAQYTKAIDTVYAKYSRDASRNSSSEEKANETDPFQTDPAYNPPKPSGTHQLGALLDHECRKMVLKPRAVKVQGGIEQEWKAVRKDGRIVYVL